MLNNSVLEGDDDASMAPPNLWTAISPDGEGEGGGGEGGAAMAMGLGDPAGSKGGRGHARRNSEAKQKPAPHASSAVLHSAAGHGTRAMLSLQLTVKSTTHDRFPFPLCAPQPSLPRSPSHITFPFLSTDPTGSSPSLSMDPGGIQTGAPPPPRAASPSSLKPRSPSLLEPALNP